MWWPLNTLPGFVQGSLEEPRRRRVLRYGKSSDGMNYRLFSPDSPAAAARRR